MKWLKRIMKKPDSIMKTTVFKDQIRRAVSRWDSSCLPVLEVRNSVCGH